MRPILIRESAAGEEIPDGRKGMVTVTSESAIAIRVLLSTGGGENSPDLSIELQPDGWAIYCQLPNGEGTKVTLNADHKWYQTEDL